MNDLIQRPEHECADFSGENKKRLAEQHEPNPKNAFSAKEFTDYLRSRRRRPYQ